MACLEVRRKTLLGVGGVQPLDQDGCQVAGQQQLEPSCLVANEKRLEDLGMPGQGCILAGQRRLGELRSVEQLAGVVEGLRENQHWKRAEEWLVQYRCLQILAQRWQ